MKETLPRYPAEAFSRRDETDDAVFYQDDRFVSHLDSLALATIEELVGRLVVEQSPVILDLMASWDSHIPSALTPARVVGLGLNENELAKNGALSEYVVHDLNKCPDLPFADETFDVVLCTVSVDYLTCPVQVFREVGRILRPGGLFLVTFSNRFFPEKVVKLWRESQEEERLLLVVDFFTKSGIFDRPRVSVSKGKPRPRDDKYADLGIPSDPVYAVYADKRVAAGTVRGPADRRWAATPFTQEQIEERKRRIKSTLRCPHCDVPLTKWEVPDSPFIEWPNEFFYVCFNDQCGYFDRGWDSMLALGNIGSYRFTYDPLKDASYPVPVISSYAPRG
jgi:SAM-dependent methyltransferase